MKRKPSGVKSAIDAEKGWNVMFDPSHVILSAKYFHIIRYDRTDYGCRSAPWREVLNPLRYEIGIGKCGSRLVINRNGRWAQ